ncbi:hypothetical protein D3C75_265600 [compost metagenome]
MCLTARIRVVLILFIQGSPAAAARTQYWVIFCYFNRILIEGEAFQYAMLLEVDIFQTSLDIGRQNAAYAGADQQKCNNSYQHGCPDRKPQIGQFACTPAFQPLVQPRSREALHSPAYSRCYSRGNQQPSPAFNRRSCIGNCREALAYRRNFVYNSQRHYSSYNKMNNPQNLPRRLLEKQQ